MEEYVPRIIINPQICHGKAHLEGTRIPIHIILDLLAAGETYENILSVYPMLKEEDILACIAYAAKLATEEVVLNSETA